MKQVLFSKKLGLYLTRGPSLTVGMDRTEANAAQFKSKREALAFLNYALRCDITRQLFEVKVSTLKRGQQCNKQSAGTGHSSST